MMQSCEKKRGPAQKHNILRYNDYLKVLYYLSNEFDGEESNGNLQLLVIQKKAK
jgi:hypothetical protein